MKYNVRLGAKAEADVAGVLAWFAEQSATAAGQKWFGLLWASLDTLETYPERCPLADESEVLGIELRELRIGKRRGVYRLLFQVRGRTVHIIRVWHSARDALSAADLGD